MKYSPGFTLIEFMISLAISSFIMVALLQSYRNSLSIMHTAGSLLSINRKAALLFNQLERDITTMIEVSPRISIKKNNEKQDEGQREVSEKKRAYSEGNGREKTSLGLQAEIYEDERRTIAGKKWEKTKSISFITTTALGGIEQIVSSPVRVQYLLEKVPSPNKKHEIYVLRRKQTSELENTTLAVKEDATEAIQNVIVADNIVHFSLQFFYEKTPEKGEKENKKERKKSWKWGKEQEKESVTHLPERIGVLVVFYDPAKRKEYLFECLIPIYAKSLPLSGVEQIDVKASPQEQKNASAGVTDSSSYKSSPQEHSDSQQKSPAFQSAGFAKGTL